MKTARKAILAVLCAVCIIVATITGTLAYLTDTDAVTNTFSVGNVRIKLDEAKVNPDGSLVTDSKNRVQANEYHLLPGQTYIKDPTVTVAYNSEDAYIRMLVKVENIDKLKAALPETKYYGEDEVFLLQMLCNNWDKDTWLYEKYTESADGKTGTYEFRYKEVVKKDDKATEATKLPYLFKSITVPGHIDNTHLANLKDVKIVVEAHAIQAAGFADADAAWEAFENQVNTNPNEEPEEEATETTVASDDLGDLFD